MINFAIKYYILSIKRLTNCMTEYEIEIRKLAEEEENKVFYNSSKSHARIVLNSMVQHAEHYVYAVCGNYCSEVSCNPEFSKIVAEYLSGGEDREFHVLFDEYNPDFLNTDIAKIFAQNPKKVKIRKFKDNGRLTYKGDRVHLTISDDRAFRLETNVDDRIAFGNFNDKKNVKVFKEVFTHYFSNDDFSEPIDLYNVS